MFPYLEVSFGEVGRCRRRVVGEEAHVAPVSDRILWWR